MLPEIPHVEPITTPVWQPNERLQSLLLADRELTPEEWAEIEAYERSADQ
jgi:hypothetical protein